MHVIISSHNFQTHFAFIDKTNKKNESDFFITIIIIITTTIITTIIINLCSTNTNDIREEIKRRINMGNACYYSLEKILSSRLLSKKLKVKNYYIIGCIVWLSKSSVTFTEEHRLRLFENKVIKKIFGAMKDEITGEWIKLHNTELHALYSSFNIIRNLK